MKPASWSRDLLDLLLPGGCVACKAWVPSGRGGAWLCGRCQSRLRTAAWPRCPRCHFPRGARRVDAPDCIECREWPPELTGARYAYVLEPPAADLVHALKYEGWSELAGLMGTAMAGAELPEAAIVVPVPTTSGRLKSRGYNQAELLARGVAEARGLRMLHAITRMGEGGSQTSLAPTERRENVRGAFASVRGADGLVAGTDVLLVDDVLTTGATASEAAVALSSMGAASVTLVAFARALPARPGRPA